MLSRTVLILILIIGFLFLSFPLGCKKLEGFYVLPQTSYKRYCDSCGYLNRRKCKSCVNCGICVTPNGYEECVPGDNKGPYFRSDCLQYFYGHQFYPYSHLTNIYRPHIHPEYKPWYSFIFPKFWKRKFSY